MARIALEEVTKRFGDVFAVRDVTLEIEDKEFLVLVGPSGCGKSTVLRLIAGLESPTNGTIRIGDREVNDVEPQDRDVAMVFQSYALYPQMTARRNIEFPLKNRGIPKAERESQVRAVADILELTEVLDRRPAQMSGGQRQRVALARAIVRRPDAFLMDEPLSNLDAKLRTQTRTELIELQRRLATTVVYVTHDQVEGMTMGHRVAVMDKGVIQQVARPVEIYHHPANLFVAGFIGNPPMNTVAGSPNDRWGDLVIETASGAIPLPLEQQEAVRQSGATAVVVGVRPEHVALNPEGPIRASVAVVEGLGYESHVVCRLQDNQQVIIRLPADAAVPRDGDNVRLTADPARLHLFDAATGQRIC
ncbi:MAG TPA: ABC transporter ATP-binding protein [Acidimicrobiales bacterium]|nr:ABC transporter ATP-binding protein [Acidimicrobiales bacterium]